jgi:hypothetical protein
MENCLGKTTVRDVRPERAIALYSAFAFVASSIDCSLSHISCVYINTVITRLYKRTITTFPNVSDILNELVQKANTSLEQGKYYVALAYKQALKEGFTPQEAKKLLLERITVFSERTIYRGLPDEAKDRKAVELALSRKKLPSLTSGNDSLESKLSRFADLESIWDDADKKRRELLGRLVAAMEALYTLQGIPINTISEDITRGLKEAGVETAHRVPDYLDDKYKRLS